MDELQGIEASLELLKDETGVCFDASVTHAADVPTTSTGVALDDTSMNSFGCPVCKSAFQTQLELLSHMELSHLRLSEFQCCICSLKFGRRNILSLHLKTVHLMPPEKAERLIEEQLKDQICDTSAAEDFIKSGNSMIRENDQLTEQAASVTASLWMEDTSVGIKEEPDFLNYEPEIIVHDGVLDVQTQRQRKDHRGRKPVTRASRRQQRRDAGNDDDDHDVDMDEADVEFDVDHAACPVCGLERPRKKLRHHLKMNHTVEEGQACDTCAKIFFSRNALKTHEKKSHQGQSSNSLACSVCDQAFLSRQEFLSHQMTQHGVSLSEEDMFDGDSSQGQRVSFMCDQCGRSYSRRSDLRTHIRRDHGDKSNWKFLCPECPKRFFSRRDLNIHLRQSHDKGPLLPCPVCEKEYTEQQLKRHLRKSHAAEVSQLCTICNAILHSRRSLEVHTLSLHGNLPAIYGCDRCGKHFKEKRSLDLHILHVHDKVRPFICEQCGRGFEGAGRLRTHINVAHLKIEKEPRHKCDLCDYKAKASNLLIKHKVNVHGQEKTHLCPNCPKSYAVKSQLSEHIRVVHMGIMIKCNICDREFTNTNTLYRHKRVVHKQEKSIAKCSDCNLTFENALVLDKHIKSLHKPHLMTQSTIQHLH